MTRAAKTQSGSTGSTTSTLSTSASATATATAPGAVSRARKTGPVVAAEEKTGAAATLKSRSNGPVPPSGSDDAEMARSWTVRNRWIVFAIASGACAAFNGVFAKLTTNELSTHIAHGISSFFGLTDLERIVEVVIRASFFGLNLAFNGVMWTLFTQALTKGQSTTQVSIINTSTNFVITALLGLAIFAESLPPLWWAGAGLLVAGNVIIGRGKQEEGSAESGAEETLLSGGGEDEYHDEASAVELGQGSGVTPQEGVLPVEKEDGVEDEDVALLGDLS
ncbi:hypothetical protein GGR53DRAFT_148896 [Hypoxylon sp. FL1150]|nr:hypothetical protein GGR53DRAFT_148896 [Hypoxylon sp. FL1150]